MPAYTIRVVPSVALQITLNVLNFPGGAPPAYSLNVNGNAVAGGPAYALQAPNDGDVINAVFDVEGYDAGQNSQAQTAIAGGAITIVYPATATLPLTSGLEGTITQHTITVVTS